MRIALIGAYGYTGRLICRELQNSSIAYSVYGRDYEKLDTLKQEFQCIKKTVAVDLRNETDLGKVLTASDLIINCAGPFTEESTLLLEKVSDCGKIYIDITGEIGFVRSSREKFHRQAQISKSLIIHACAFESLIADLALQRLASTLSTSVNSVRTFYSFNQNRVSPGTRITMKLAKFRKILKIENKEWHESDFTKDQLRIKINNNNEEQIAIPYALPEIAFSFWNYKVEQSASFLLLSPSEAKFMSGIYVANGTALENLDKIRIRKPKGPSEEERAEQKSLIAINVLDGKGQTHNLVLQSYDMYLTTAKAVLVTLQKILAFVKVPDGVLSPAQLFKEEEEKTLIQLNTQILNDSHISINPC